MNNLNINKEVILKVLIIIVLLLAVAGYLAEYIKEYYHNYEQYRLINQFVRIFNLGEGTFHTWFSSSLFLFCSLALAIIAYVKKRTNDKYVFH
ncbi:MAG: hypothetical protein ACR2NW_06825, partial [Thermodesulfobacteriota bacterium]